MLHGMVSTGDSWGYVFNALKDRYQVIAPDMPGHGRSSGRMGPYGLAVYVDWLADFFDALQIPETTLIGHSMGGAIAAAFAIRHPERLSRLILVDALGMSSRIPWRAARSIVTSLPDYLISGLTHRNDPYLLRFFQPWAFLDPWGSPRETIERMAAINQPRELAVTWAGTRLLLADFMWRHRRLAFIDKLGRITTPTLVVWGRHDGLLALENAREGIARIPRVTLEVIEDSAHEPMLEQPEAFIPVVRKFLERTG
jgi:pimeloyl-ACP methyl ester carboxylesterase